MFTLVKMSGRWIASTNSDLLDPDTQEGIEHSACQGTPVIICDTLEDFSDMFDVPIKEIEVVDD